MKTTTLADMDQHLDDLGLNQTIENLIVHSSLMSFGRPEFSAEELYTLIRSKIAENATIFVPAFTLNMTEEDVFDAASTLSNGMGTFSEFVRKLPDALRANNPMHSYAAIGPNAKILEKASNNLSFGENSCFEKMATLSPHLLLLGCPFHHGATHIHQQEALIGVPYRLWLDLKRKIKQNGKIEDIIFRYYGMKRDIPAEWSPIRVLEYLQQENKVIERPAPYGKSYALKLLDLDFAAKTVLQQDNNALNII